YLELFLEGYKKVSTIPFVCNAHVTKFDEEIAKLLKEAGCFMVKFGIESGSNRIRREILNRYMSNKTIERAFGTARKAGLYTSAFVMIGLPCEGSEEIEETIDLLATIKPSRIRWSVFFPYCGTVAYDISKNNGFIDFKKIESLSNFTSESCLDFGEEHNLYIEKLQKTLPWYVNAKAGFDSSSIYRNFVSEIDAMEKQSWNGFEDRVLETDRSLSYIMTANKRDHYAIKYNDFMAVREG
ncbi:MAG: radical SAM protein, partial [Thermodesulfobacteriota bacterium]|nr:radical SAM protein [Thermodesulfobacteriota bacterium]